MPVDITQENFEQEIAQEKKPIILDVYATWCGPCQQMEPIIHEVEKKLGSKYKFAKLNVDEARDLAIKYGVTSVPTFVFILDNEVLHKATGYMDEDDFEEQVLAAFGNRI